jgi:hypothetical protein
LHKHPAKSLTALQKAKHYDRSKSNTDCFGRTPGYFGTKNLTANSRPGQRAETNRREPADFGSCRDSIGCATGRLSIRESSQASLGTKPLRLDSETFSAHLKIHH